VNEMKNKTNRNLTIFLIIWFASFIINIICVYTIAWPILTLPIMGGEVTLFIGLGYLIEIYSPLTTLDSPIQSSIKIQYAAYVVISILLIAFLIFRVIRQRRKDRKH